MNIKTMTKEKSCGAVVYRKHNGFIEFLVQIMSAGHISLPKGHVEEGETEIETALREIKEETSLDVIIDSSFREVVTYSPFPNVIKDVVFFIAESKENVVPIDLHDNEVRESRFLPFEEAYNFLTYETDKNVLKKAYQHLFS